MGFQFKQFSVEDGHSSMKVGTDALLLGAWADISGCRRILEVGTGCGVIALMLAQRSTAEITAIDIHAGSVEDARLNFSYSPWSKRLTAIEISLRKYCDPHPGSFDLIVTNPPYFANSLRSPHHNRNLSRHDESLGLPELLRCTDLLLESNGRLCLIIPASEAGFLEQQARTYKLHLFKKTEITMREGKKASRILYEFRKSMCVSPVKSTIIIRNADNEYTMEYRELTGSYYAWLN